MPNVVAVPVETQPYGSTWRTTHNYGYGVKAFRQNAARTAGTHSRMSRDSASGAIGREQRSYWIVIVAREKGKRPGEIYRERAENDIASDGSIANLYADDAEGSHVQQWVGTSTEWLAERMSDVPVSGHPLPQGRS
jgi:hypothetical protein